MESGSNENYSIRNFPFLCLSQNKFYQEILFLISRKVEKLINGKDTKPEVTEG